MKLALALVLVAIPASVFAAEGDTPPEPERAAECISKSNDAVGCFVEQATFRFLYCKLTVEAVIAGLPKDAALACSHSGDRALSDFYASALKRFPKNKAAQSMTKDYYAFWISAMRALVPSGEMSRVVWRTQAATLEAELNQRGERLKLEK